MCASLNQEALKAAVREALRDVLAEERDLFSDIVREAIEDYAMMRAIEEGEHSGKADPKAVRRLLHAR